MLSEYDRQMAADIDDIGVPDGEGESFDEAAARLRGEQMATVYLIDTGEETHVWPGGYPTGAEANEDWTVMIAWWHIDTARRRIA